ncbi:hypothetical protein CYMTET_11935, partial [Cymbomonas tetramitiformis]
ELELQGAPLQVVGQGFLGGTVAAVFASRYQENVKQLVLMNAPLDEEFSGSIPQPLAPLLNPLFGQIFCQNPLKMVGQPIESSGPYSLDVNDQVAYQQPLLSDGNAGFAAMEICKQMKKSGGQATRAALEALSEDEAPETVVAWGLNDVWLGERAPSAVPKNAKIIGVSGVGHFAPEDWAEKAADVILGVQADES